MTVLINKFKLKLGLRCGTERTRAHATRDLLVERAICERAQGVLRSEGRITIHFLRPSPDVPGCLVIAHMHRGVIIRAVNRLKKIN